MKISVLGSGNVGQKLTHLFSAAGHDVFVGNRAEAGSIEAAVAAGDIVVLAVPYTACAELLPSLADALAGKIVIDSTNPLNADWSPLSLGAENSAGEEIARLLPRSHVIKAFNTIFADIMQPDRIERGGQRVTAFVAGDEDEAKQQVLRLADSMGLAPLDAGPLTSARYLESMAHLNIQIAVGQGGGTNAAFLYHQVRA